MRPTFMGFETATRGLMVNQKALDIVGNNTTNIGVTGYTRQRVDLVSLSVNMRYTRYNQNTTSFAGQGVGTYGVTQIRDAFLDKRFREEYSDVGYYNATSSVLDELSSALDEITPSTMSVAMMNFQNTWTEMQKKSNESTNAANILASATQVVSIFQQMSAKLDNVWNQQDYNLGLNINEVNSILARIADLNESIYKQQFNNTDSGTQPLELMDQRNVLLDQLSGYADITYRDQGDGTVTVYMGGHKAVEGKDYQTLAKRVNGQDENYKTETVFWNDSGEEANFTTGSLLGALHMLNGRGIDVKGNVGENVQEGILYYKEKIDQFARTFADAFNTAIEQSGSGYKKLFDFVPENSLNAASIRISSEWAADATYIYKDIKDKIEDGTDSNTFAAKVGQLFEKELDFGEFKGTLNDYIMFYSVTKLSNNKAYSDSRLESVSGISDTILSKIQQISGVSMEEEGIDLMQYKKAYDAVARVFTTLDEMLDKLINGTGVVGR